MEWVVVREMTTGYSNPVSFAVDVEQNREDALILAQLYAEQHAQQAFYPHEVGEVQNLRGELQGYGFVTHGGTLVNYCALPKADFDKKLR